MGCCVSTQSRPENRRMQPYREPVQEERRPPGGYEMPVRNEEQKFPQPEQPAQAQQDEYQDQEEDEDEFEIFHPRKATQFVGQQDVERLRKATVKDQPDIPKPEIGLVIAALRRKAQKQAGVPQEEEEEDDYQDDSDSDYDIDDQEGLSVGKTTKDLDRRLTAFRVMEVDGQELLPEEEAKSEADEPEQENIEWDEVPPTPQFQLAGKVRSPEELGVEVILSSAILYEDEDFPHNDESIFDPERGSNENLDALEWRSAREIFGAGNYQVLPENDDEITPNEIKQGVLGDCYFLSGLAGLAEFPNRVRALFSTQQPNVPGLYVVRLYLNGECREVVVDEYFPYKEGQFAFCHCGEKKHIWPMLLEKAYAKVFGSYQRIESGTMMESLQAVTSAYVEVLDHAKLPPEEFWTRLVAADQSRFIMLTNVHSEGDASASSRVKALGLVDNHAYTLIGAFDVNTDYGPERLLKVRNPWGRGEWEGDWSDNSDKWTEPLKAQLNFQNRDDGVFFINLGDFLKNFHNTTLAKVRDGWQHKSVGIRMRRAGERIVRFETQEAGDFQLLYFQPGMRHLTGSKNAQFHFELLNFALLRREGDQYIWVTKERFHRSSNCTGLEIHLDTPGEYFVFLEIEAEDTRPADEQVHSWLVILSSCEIDIKGDPADPRMEFVEKMMKACCLAQTQSYQYAEHGSVKRHFAMAESQTSLAAFYYFNGDTENAFQEKMMFTALEGVELIGADPGAEEFEVDIEPGKERVQLLRRAGKETTRVAYKFISRAELGEAALLAQMQSRGKSMQIEDYRSPGSQLAIWVKSYFTMGQGVLLVENKEAATKIEFTFKFKGSENLQIKGAGKDALEISVKSRPGTAIPIHLGALNVWEPMPIRYSYSYRLL